MARPVQLLVLGVLVLALGTAAMPLAEKENEIREILERLTEMTERVSNTKEIRAAGTSHTVEKLIVPESAAVNGGGGGNPYYAAELGKGTSDTVEELIVPESAAVNGGGAGNPYYAAQLGKAPSKPRPSGTPAGDGQIIGSMAARLEQSTPADLVAFLELLPFTDLLVAAWGEEGLQTYIEEASDFFPPGTSTADVLDAVADLALTVAMGVGTPEEVVTYIFGSSPPHGVVILHVLTQLPVEETLSSFAEIKGITSQEFQEECMSIDLAPVGHNERDALICALVASFSDVSADDEVAFLEALPLDVMLSTAWGQEGLDAYLAEMQSYFDGVEQQELLGILDSLPLWQILGTNDTSQILTYITGSPYPDPAKFRYFLEHLPQLEVAVDAIAHCTGTTPEALHAYLLISAASSDECSSPAPTANGKVLGAIAARLEQSTAADLQAFLELLPFPDLLVAAWGPAGVHMYITEASPHFPPGTSTKEILDIVADEPLTVAMGVDTTEEVLTYIFGISQPDGVALLRVLSHLPEEDVLSSFSEIEGITPEELQENIESIDWDDKNNLVDALMSKFSDVSTDDMVAFLDALPLDVMMLTAWGQEGLDAYLAEMQPYFDGMEEHELLDVLDSLPLSQILGTDDTSQILEYISGSPFVDPEKLRYFLEHLPKVGIAVDAIARITGTTPEALHAYLLISADEYEDDIGNEDGDDEDGDETDGDDEEELSTAPVAAATKSLKDRKVAMKVLKTLLKRREEELEKRSVMEMFTRVEDIATMSC